MYLQPTIQMNPRKQELLEARFLGTSNSTSSDGRKRKLISSNDSATAATAAASADVITINDNSGSQPHSNSSPGGGGGGGGGANNQHAHQAKIPNLGMGLDNRSSVLLSNQSLAPTSQSGQHLLLSNSCSSPAPTSSSQQQQQSLQPPTPQLQQQQQQQQQQLSSQSQQSLQPQPSSPHVTRNNQQSSSSQSSSQNMSTAASCNYFNHHLHSSSSTHLLAVCKSVQTDVTIRSLRDDQSKSVADIEERDGKIDELTRGSDELKRQVAQQNKVIDKQKEQLAKSVDVTKQLLVEKSQMEKKAARQKCMQNRLRLGQFVTQRQGASFVENWVDGHAFTELNKKQEMITQEKEEIDRQRKILAKRKPLSVQGKKGHPVGDRNNFTHVAASLSASSSGLTTTGPGASSPSGSSGGGSGGAAVNVVGASIVQGLSNGAVIATSGFSEFTKPKEPAVSLSSSSLSQQGKELSWYEYYEMDEILKLRQASLKKEDADVSIEMEKLERERNLHIRELKRIHNEDQSRFNSHVVLNDRYLLLTLLGKGGFSEVHKAFDLKEQRYVACKIHQLNKDWKDDKKANYIKHALREYNIHKQLDHPRIVRLFDVFEIDSNSFCTVLEYCDGHDLDFYLKQHKFLPEREARSIIMQVVHALKYLNEIKPAIIHYDLKPGMLSYSLTA